MNVCICNLFLCLNFTELISIPYYLSFLKYYSIQLRNNYWYFLITKKKPKKRLFIK